jgi:hypothetical protein
LTFLLVAGAISSGLACSAGKPSEIGKADIAKLNSANSRIWSLAVELQAESRHCAGAAHSLTCKRRELAKYVARMRSAAVSYDEVARNAKGTCRAALRGMARDIRSEVTVTTRTNSYRPRPFEKDAEAIAKACLLRFSSTG